MTPNTIDDNTAIIATATTVAAPRSSVGLARGDRLGDDAHTQQRRRGGTDPGHHEVAVMTQLQYRTRRADAVRGIRRRRIVTSGGQSGRLPCRVDTTHLDHQRRAARQPCDQHDRERGDGERCLDRGATRRSTQTLVLSALVMMFVSAVTIESPVTTV
jgi:hypothetical protein